MSSNTKINIDKIKKDNKMYKYDLDNGESTNAFKKKLEILKNEKDIIFKHHKNMYDINTNIMKNKLNNERQTQVILNTQHKIMKENDNKIKRIKIDILTIRRQVEIDEESFRRRNNKIFLLKTTFIYLIVFCLPILLVRNKNINNQTGTYTIILISLIFFMLVLWNFYHTKNRNPLRYDLKQWNSPKKEQMQETKYDKREDDLQINYNIKIAENINEKESELKELNDILNKNNGVINNTTGKIEDLENLLNKLKNDTSEIQM